MKPELEKGKIYKALEEFYFILLDFGRENICFLEKENLVLILNTDRANMACGTENWVEFLILSGEHKGKRGFRNRNPLLAFLQQTE